MNCVQGQANTTLKKPKFNSHLTLILTEESHSSAINFRDSTEKYMQTEMKNPAIIDPFTEPPFGPNTKYLSNV